MGKNKPELADSRKNKNIFSLRNAANRRFYYFYRETMGIRLIYSNILLIKLKTINYVFMVFLRYKPVGRSYTEKFQLEFHSV